MVSLVLLIALGSFLLILLLYYLIIFSKLSFYKHVNSTSNKPPVSVIIAARNEIKNLQDHLPIYLDMDYPEYEIIVINDGSYDGTKDYLKEMEAQHEKIKVVSIFLDDKFQKGKKFALTLGIKAASHKRLLFTDADCTPASNQWITHMVQAANNKALVLGYAPLTTKNNILGSLIQYETFHTGLQYFSYGLRGNAYMGVGRNLSYTSDLFFENKGFASHQHLLSGDDDLFIQEVANKNNVAICIDPNSFQESKAPSGIKKWYRQKNRHISASSTYKVKYKFLLGLYSLSQIMFYLLVIANLILLDYWMFTLIALGIKWLIQWIVFFKPTQLLKTPKIRYALPYYDILYTLYLLIFGIAKPFTKSTKWN